MDKSYNRTAAVEKLEELALDRYNSAHSGTQLSRITSASAHYEALCVGRCWNVVLRNSTEELVVSFQAILVKKDLPPFVERLGRASHHIKYLRQSISVAGFSTLTFSRAVNAIADVHALLGRAVGIDNVLDCGMIGCVNDVQVVEMSNRYFKPRHANTANDDVALSVDIDPHGYLAKAALAAGLYHSEDNVVQYYERIGTDDESYKYNKVKPIMFGVGDIVEIQASFVLYPLKDGKFKSAMVLRGLTLLDGTFTQDQVRNMVVQKLPMSLPTVIKRKVGYGEETLSVTRAKLARLEIDQRADGEAVNAEGSGLSQEEKITDVNWVGGLTDNNAANLD